MSDMKRDFFLRLPRPMALLLLSAILDLTSAHALYPFPRQTRSSPQPITTTLSHHAIETVPYPPLPTSPPKFGLDLLRRQELNTICGYIGGDPNLPATCDLGSHCVLDTQHGAVGCCPDTEATCTTGVFTECVDGNSPPQTELNPYVFTCQGGNVCYKNVFEGGFFQFGCGTASDLATSVAATATGITDTLSRPSVTFSFTETAETLSAPTTLATVTVSSSTEQPTESMAPVSSKPATTTEVTSQTSKTETTHSASSTTSKSKTSSSFSSSTSSSSTSSSSTSSTLSTTTTSSETSTLSTPTSNLVTSSATAAPPAIEPQSRNRTGAIIGGTIGGLALLIAAIALGIYLWRRKKRTAMNKRHGPGGSSTEYISPMQGAPYDGTGFAPLHQDQEGWETGMAPTAMVTAGGAGLAHYGEDSGYPRAMTGYDHPSQYPAGYGVAAGSSAAAGAAAGVSRPLRPDTGLYEPEAADRIPLRREIDDFSRGFHDALGRIGEEDEYDSSPNRSGTGVNEGNGVSGPSGTGHAHGADDDVGPYGGVRPLWQQQRRQSRNLMWM